VRYTEQKKKQSIQSLFLFTWISRSLIWMDG
jgi:hypothetical protein